jgi:hypothetical protein
MNYKSSLNLLGLPLVHVAVGPTADSTGIRRVAKGWIAVGDIAVGVVFAIGGVAAGGVSVGGLSLGAFALAGFSVGIWSVGGLAIGAFAVGGAAIAAWAAEGGLAIAREYAAGGLVIGANASPDAARTYFENSLFFRAASGAARHSRYLLVMTIVVSTVMGFMRWRGSRSA